MAAEVEGSRNQLPCREIYGGTRREEYIDKQSDEGRGDDYYLDPISQHRAAPSGKAGTSGKVRTGVNWLLDDQ